MAQTRANTSQTTSGKISLKDSSSVLARKTETVYPIKDSEWSELKILVREKEPFDSLPLNILFACIGVAASVIIAILTSEQRTLYNLCFVILLILGGIAVFLGIIMFIFHERAKKRDEHEKNKVLAKMERIESLFDK